jgi:putative transcriptional regulator
MMKTKREFKGAGFEAIHSAVAAMHGAGTADKETMRSFDETCLVSPEVKARGADLKDRDAR